MSVLFYQVTERELDDWCSKYGKVVEAKLALDRVTGRPKGFAFVTMSSRDEAEDVVKGLNGKEVDGKEIKAEISHGQGGRRNTREVSDFEDAKRTGMCYDFIRGKCSRGDSCRFNHGDRRSDDRGRDRDYDRRDDRGRDRRGSSRSRSRDRR